VSDTVLVTELQPTVKRAVSAQTAPILLNICMIGCPYKYIYDCLIQTNTGLTYKLI
jgi:hypothetical protein